jgi:NADH-quinone oxidoreductase subunit N
MLDNFQSLVYFLPETILTVAILAILTVDLLAGQPNLKRTAGLALAGLGASFIATVATMDGNARGLFGGLIARDPMSDFFKLFFLATTALIGVAAMRARDAVDYDGDKERDKESAEFYTLMLTTTIGMFLMASSTDLLVAFLSLETVSIMSYILSGFKRRDRRSSEASLKYVIYGGVASGVMLYGMSFLYGLAGSTSFTAVQVAATNTPATAMVVLAVVLCLAGFGYKIASVPFHMWCPDVYEGAPTPVTAFLSVGPKAAGFALLIRFFVSGAIPATLGSGATQTSPWALLLGIIACATMTLGNLAALQQNNLKRMFAYSSIAHAGYLLLGLCALTPDGVRAILIYLLTYLFMNVGAFVVIMAMSDAGLGENVDDYQGLGRRAPWAAFAMAVFLSSLTGLPPLAGFFGKFYLFYALLAKGGTLLVTVAIIGVLNSAVSLFYYARVFRAMYFDAPTSEAKLSLPRIHTVTMGLMAIPTVLLFLVAWTPVEHFINSSLLQWYPAVAAAAKTAALP